MINPKLGYSDETEALIERQCCNVERLDFKLDKKAAAETILKTYDLFALPRPKKVVWCKDIFDKDFDDAAGSAWSAGSARSARSARSAGSAGSARSARSAGSARSAWSAWSARSAGSAWSAWSAWSAGSARSARSARSAGSAGSAGSARSAGWTALDYDFDWYVIEHEYIQNPDADRPVNEHDHEYLEYCELLMQAKEAGAGYRVEWKDTLYVVPTPLVRLDKQLRYHSEDSPAIRWKGGKEFYYLKGENFEKPLWEKIVKQTITAEEVMQITDADKREIAFSMLGADAMIKGLNAELVDTGKKDGTKLYKCPNFRETGETRYLMVMKDCSTDRQFVEGVPNELGEKGSADLAQAMAMGLALKEYMSMELRA